jgi:transglutaminase/protease-like cytokinesis protein 3
MDWFAQEVHELMCQYPRDRIVNVDETNWKAVRGEFPNEIINSTPGSFRALAPECRGVRWKIAKE